MERDLERFAEGPGPFEVELGESEMGARRGYARGAAGAVALGLRPFAVKPDVVAHRHVPVRPRSFVSIAIFAHPEAIRIHPG